MAGDWFECRACQGHEGELVDGDWVDCRECQGRGGSPDNIYADSASQ